MTDNRQRFTVTKNNDTFQFKSSQNSKRNISARKQETITPVLWKVRVSIQIIQKIDATLSTLKISVFEILRLEKRKNIKTPTL